MTPSLKTNEADSPSRAGCMARLISPCFSPAPWVAKRHRRNHEHPTWTVHAKGACVSQAYCSDSTCTNQIAGLGVRAYRLMEVAANAQLIANSPKMYEMLCNIEHILKSDIDPSVAKMRIQDVFDSAIANLRESDSEVAES